MQILPIFFRSEMRTKQVLVFELKWKKCWVDIREELAETLRRVSIKAINAFDVFCPAMVERRMMHVSADRPIAESDVLFGVKNVSMPERIYEI